MYRFSRLTLLVILLAVISVNAQDNLTIEKIMRDSKWMGSSPSNIFWSENGDKLYFDWNPGNNEDDSLYFITVDNLVPHQVSEEEREALPTRWDSDYNKDKTKKLYSDNGDIFLLDILHGKVNRLTYTNDYESNPQFTFDEKAITYTSGDNLFIREFDSGEIKQLTDFKKGNERKDRKPNDHKQWLKDQQLDLIDVIKERHEKAEEKKAEREKNKVKRPLEIYVQESRVSTVLLSPDENYVTFILTNSPSNAERTIIPQYVTETGFTETSNAYPKVGDEQSTYKFGIYDLQQDTVYYADTKQVPGVYDRPEYLKDYVVEGDTFKPKYDEPREVLIHGPVYSDDGKNGLVIIRSNDNKDRWLMLLNLENGSLESVHRDHDEAWIGGPGVSSWNAFWGDLGWLKDNETVWFQSEETGYSHLYTYNIKSKMKKQLTAGKFEVFDPQLSNDGKYFYFTSSEVNPGERHFYKMKVDGTEKIYLTSAAGNNDVTLSPGEKWIAIRYSYSNKPWELYLLKNEPGAEMIQITESQSEEFKSYNWRDPEIVWFEASDGVEVPARLYRPENPEPDGKAVIFVHGAGYLQNVHKWWSSYFREFMFHNLLVNKGYTVLDIDYRGSAGYGRDWRTAIYRHMGGNDLSDQVDGAKFLIDEYNIDPNRIGIYGGSYGGFITLMAMFKHPDIFSAGAALRSVTDWAHYHHGYTANILNTPVSDSLAYVKSSPIYFAEGLEGALLMCHGMVDDNVHFQDIVRLTQRLIELGKDNWELAVYPVERHSFTEPSSWIDEYKRILKLFEENL
ncbi:MAG: prolyl oligopeptidase family serine peptidase [Melioribacteraceae bacterium]|nr:prolyl oligopeptidase family serine peptidase [Melioribacteraceae bacterium]MCF8356942.1 prolyl oligopeptidase family serine peptidase [Melioribacteraceae bacterium]MCF8396381.1 prolyl oligopeptidase family serine peptidase [Melioribacteraceae bacterium]